MKQFIYITLLVLFTSCNATKIKPGMVDNQAPVIIYRSTGDYYHNVPIILNDAKDKVVSYPAPSDFLYEGEPVFPVMLKDGYLLDRRGVNVNTAFTSYNIESYAVLESPPSLDELYNSIIDKNPFESMYHCGKRSEYGNLEKELNKRINRGMKDFTPIFQ